MSNQVALFEDGSALPDYLRRGLDESTKSLMGTLTKRISIRGGVYRMLVGGQEIAKSEDRTMNVVIIRNGLANTRTFFVGGYVEGEATKPTCFSDDDIKPSAKAATPQSTHCATCPQNVKGSGTQGESKACRYSRRAAVMLENDIGGDIYAMSFSATSLFGDDPNKMGFQQYGRFLGGHGAPINSVVTQLKFDTDSATPKLLFKPVRPLTSAEYDLVMAKVDDPTAQAAVNFNVAELDGVVKEDTPAPAPVPKPEPKPEPKPAPAAVKPVVKPTAPVAPATPKPNPFAVQKPAEPIPEPTVRPAATVQELVGGGATTNADVASVLADWSETDD